VARPAALAALHGGGADPHGWRASIAAVLRGCPGRAGRGNGRDRRVPGSPGAAGGRGDASPHPRSSPPAGGAGSGGPGRC
jgi:hypothetical protein